MSSKLMQLPMLFGVRGSLATQTMRGQTKEQIREVESIVNEVMEDEILIGDKIEFCRQLGQTIGGDYRSDRDTAIAEFRIAIWRATVQLLYHRSYSYSCTICGATEYITASTGKTKAFDRQYPFCPHCRKSRVNGQLVSMYKVKDRYNLVDDNGGMLLENSSRSIIEKKVDTPIKAICGERAVSDPQRVLNNPEERRKWYKVWIWNYFRQVLNENSIKLKSHQVKVSAPADLMAVNLIINELKKKKIRYYYDESRDIVSDTYEIFTQPLTTDLRFTAFLMSIKHGYLNYGIELEATSYSIKIKSDGDPPIIDAEITTEDPVIVIRFSGPSGGDDDSRNWADSIEASIDGDEPGYADITKFVENDMITTVRAGLPDDACRKVMEIYCQVGDTWQDFSNEYGMKTPAKAHISKYLGISAKKVEEYINTIGMAYTRLCATDDCSMHIQRECRALEQSIDDDISDYLDMGKDEADAVATALEDAAEALSSMNNTIKMLMNCANDERRPTSIEVFNALKEDLA